MHVWQNSIRPVWASSNGLQLATLVVAGNDLIEPGGQRAVFDALMVPVWRKDDQRI